MSPIPPPPFMDENLEEVARRLEAAFSAVNAGLLKAAGLEADALIEAFGEVHARMLGFDEFGRKALADAIENARVKTYSQGNVFLACVLCSAVALSEFKKQPRSASGRWAKQIARLRDKSTNSISLGVFATASFYALLGSKAWKRLSTYRKNRPMTLT